MECRERMIRRIARHEELLDQVAAANRQLAEALTAFRQASLRHTHIEQLKQDGRIGFHLKVWPFFAGGRRKIRQSQPHRISDLVNALNGSHPGDVSALSPCAVRCQLPVCSAATFCR